MAWLIGGFFVASGLFAAFALVRITALSDRRWNTFMEAQGEEPDAV